MLSFARAPAGTSVQELLYNASALAHHAQVSTQSPVDLPTPATLTEVFDAFALDTSLGGYSTMMEAAGAQCLLLAGSSSIK